MWFPVFQKNINNLKQSISLRLQYICTVCRVVDSTFSSILSFVLKCMYSFVYYFALSKPACHYNERNYHGDQRKKNRKRKKRPPTINQPWHEMLNDFMHLTAKVTAVAKDITEQKRSPTNCLWRSMLHWRRKERKEAKQWRGNSSSWQGCRPTLFYFWRTHPTSHKSWL